MSEVEKTVPAAEYVAAVEEILHLRAIVQHVLNYFDDDYSKGVDIDALREALATPPPALPKE